MCGVAGGRFALGVALLCLIRSPVRAEVEPVLLEELVRGSEVIVVADVVLVRDENAKNGKGERVAVARVRERWKGSSGDTVEFFAHPAWACDVSDAKEGETVVLFLRRTRFFPPAASSGSTFFIAHHGRGRMPLVLKTKARYAEVSLNEVALPRTGLRLWTGPSANDSKRFIEFESLKRYARRLLSAQK